MNEIILCERNLLVLYFIIEVKHLYIFVSKYELQSATLS